MAEYLTLFDENGRDTGFVQLRDEYPDNIEVLEEE